jgi:hypothetical protein
MRPLVLGLLSAAACASPGSAGSASPGSAASASSSIAGAWTSKVEFRSGALAAYEGLEFMLVFGEGGTLTESSNYDAAPPVPPAYGTWTETGPNRFRARYEFFVTRAATEDEAEAAGGGWMPNGHGVLFEEIELAPDGRSFASTIRCDFFDAAGKPAEGGGSGVARGARHPPP